MQPTEPTKTCRACNGRGGYPVWQSGKPVGTQECHECEGEGSVWWNHIYDDSEDPTAPDTYKEAYGYA